MRENWSGTVTYSTSDVREPRSVEELQEIVAGASRVKALGSGHSFNQIIDTTGTLVSTRALGTSVEVDASGSEVAVPAATTYGELGQQLHTQGWGLPNMG